MDLTTSIALNVFIASWLLLFLAWDLPPQARLYRLIRRASRFILYAGLDHDWSMFAPCPPKGNFFAEFEIAYADGTSDTFHIDGFGHPEAPPGPRSPRYMKLALALMSPGDSAIKASFCDYLVRTYGRSPAPSESRERPRLRAVEVRFLVLSQPTPPMGRAGSRPAKTTRTVVYRRPLEPSAPHASAGARTGAASP
jgi:hypothetical protein